MKKTSPVLRLTLPPFLLSEIQPPYRFPALKYSSFLNSTHQPNQTSPSVVSCLCRRRDPISFAAALSFASNSKNPSLGSQIHAQISKLGFCTDMFFQNNLLVMYAKCKLNGHALNMFDEMTQRNIVSWTAMISGCVHNNEFDMGLELYLVMNRLGFGSNEFTLASVFSACAAVEDISFGSSIHSHVFKTGMHDNLFVCSSLLCMYAKCGDVGTAEQVFELVRHRDITCWNAMLEGYALNNCGYAAMKFASLMLCSGVSADLFTYTSVLKVCSNADDLIYGQQVHGSVIRNELEFSTLAMNSLAGMYIRTAKTDSALKVFHRTQQKDIISWNTLMSAFAQYEDATEVVLLFSEMLLSGFKPSHVTFSIILRLCGAKNDLALGLQFFGFVYHLGFLNDTLVVNSLLNMFAKCGLIQNAQLLFKSFPHRNRVTWNEMIVGYNLNGHASEAIQLYCDLHKLGVIADEFTYSGVLRSCQGIQHQRIGEQVHVCAVKSGLDSSCFVGSSLVNAYAKFGLVGDSFKIFQGIGIADLVSWGNMISVFSKQGFDREALLLLNCFRETSEKPDEFVLGSALSACANIAAFQQGKCIHSLVIKTSYETRSCVASALIDAYAKCGDIDGSKKVFSQLPQGDDPIIFNTMITAYAHHGHFTEAIQLFEKMKLANIEPSHATFVAVISACSHFGLVEQGQRFFDSISSDYGMAPSSENYACLVDLHARNGSLEKAKEVIQCMPFEPWPAIWRSLLSGCRIYSNKEIGKLAAQQIIQLTPDNAAAHILLSKIYAEEGSWEEAVKVRKIMLEKGVRKLPGCSWVET